MSLHHWHQPTLERMYYITLTEAIEKNKKLIIVPGFDVNNNRVYNIVYKTVFGLKPIIAQFGELELSFPYKSTEEAQQAIDNIKHENHQLDS